MNKKLLLIPILALLLVLFSSLALAHSYTPLTYFPFDSDLDDVENYQVVTGTYQGFIPAVVGNGVDLESGSGDRIYNATISNFINASTIEFWVIPESLVGTPYFLYFGTDANNGLRYFYDDGGVSPTSAWAYNVGATIFELDAPQDPPACKVGAKCHFIITFNGSQALLYMNATLIATYDTAITSIGYTWATNFFLGSDKTSTNNFDGIIDNFAIFDEQYTEADVVWSFNGGSGQDYSGGAPPNPNDWINISESYPPNNFITNLTYTIDLNVTINSSYNYNTTFYLGFNGETPSANISFLNQAGGQNVLVNFTKTLQEGNFTYYINVSVGNQSEQSSSKTIFIDMTTPTISATSLSQLFWTASMPLSINVSDINLYSFGFNDSCLGSYYNNSILAIYRFFETYGLLNCPIGTKQFNLTVCDGKTSALNCLSQTYNWNNMGQLNITAYSFINGSGIEAFSVDKNGVFDGNTITGVYYLNNLSAGNVNVTINANGFASLSQIISITNTSSSLNFTMFPTNSISINIFRESDGSRIYQNVSIKFSNIYTEWTNITNTSTFFIQDLNITQYTLLFESEGFSPRTYIVTVGNNSWQNLNAYLISGTNTTLFTVYDKDTSVILDDVLMTMYKVINGSWTAVESKYTDITGKAQFNYIPLTNYKFYLSKTGYEDYVFYLNPILFSSYDVKMTSTAIINTSQDFDQVAIIFSPTIFTNGENTTFNFIISSPSGVLTGYGFNISYPGGSVVTSGSNAIGGQLSAWVNITGANIFDTVKLNYYYTTSLAGQRNFTTYFSIYFPAGSGFNILSNRTQTYGLGIFERILISTFIFLFVVGIATMLGQPLPGFGLGIIVMGFMVYSGFIPIWLILPSAFAGILFIIWRSS